MARQYFEEVLQHFKIEKGTNKNYSLLDMMLGYLCVNCLLERVQMFESLLE